MKPYANNPFQRFSCMIMLVAFLLLTTLTGFLSVEQQKQEKSKTSSASGDKKAEKTSAPFENATEEKTGTSPTTFSDEYLREDTEHFLPTDIPFKHNKCHDEEFFVTFFGDSVSQPPESIS